MKSSLLLLTALTAICQALPYSKIVKRDYQIQLKSDTEFCSFMPPSAGDDVGATENDGKPFCTSTDLGGEEFPSGFIQSSHYADFGNYVQVTGTIDASQYALSRSDGGGQYDDKDIDGVTCNGYNHFVNLVEPDAQVFCIRCCEDPSDCNLGMSEAGCERIVPGNYD